MKSFFIRPWLMGICLGLFLTSTLNTPVWGQAVNTQEKSEATAKQKTGLRFVLKDKDRQEGETPYVIVDAKTVIPIDIQTSSPSQRIPFPKDGTLRFFKEIPTKEKKNVPFYSAPVPTNMGNKLLGLISINDQGKYQIEYLDENKLKPGMIYFNNMTNQELMIHMPDVPSPEKKEILLKGGSEYILGGNSLPSTTTQIYKASLLHKASIKNMGDRWLPLVKFRITRYQKRAVLCLLLPDSSSQNVIFSQILITQ
ncbi:MAG: hypothetical protein RR719_09135 [Akkermansia sp.]